jgi:hypothetical protein
MFIHANKKGLLIILLSMVNSLSNVYGMEEEKKLYATPEKLKKYHEAAKKYGVRRGYVQSGAKGALAGGTLGYLGEQGIASRLAILAAQNALNYQDAAMQSIDQAHQLENMLPEIERQIKKGKMFGAVAAKTKEAIQYEKNRTNFDIYSAKRERERPLQLSTYAPGIGTALGGVAGLLYNVRSEYLAADPGWAEQLGKLNATNISDTIIRSNGKDYITAQDFNNLEAPHFHSTVGGALDWHAGYEFHLMTMPLHQIGLFLHLQNAAKVTLFVKDLIAIIAVRPSPRIYDTSGIKGRLFAGKLNDILARIIIFLKTDLNKDQAQIVARWIYYQIQGYAQAKNIEITDLNPNGYWPSYTQELTPVSHVLFARYNSITYAKMQAKQRSEFAYKSYFFTANDDLAYPNLAYPKNKLNLALRPLEQK